MKYHGLSSIKYLNFGVITLKLHRLTVLMAMEVSALVKEGSTNYTSGLNIPLHAPGDATGLTPAQATTGFSDAFLKALASYSLQGH